MVRLVVSRSIYRSERETMNHLHRQITGSRETIMKSFLVMSLLAAVTFLTSRANLEAQQPKGLQKWEYATLGYVVFRDPGAASWITPKAEMGGSLSKINKDLGWKEDVELRNVCILLNRVGQDGWELVTHTREISKEGLISCTWTFKRPAAPPAKGERQAK
jgi:hypothetical protein